MTLKKKILIFVLSVMAAVILAVGVTLTVMFFPRKLSIYIRISADKIDAIYLEYLNDNYDGSSQVSIAEEDYAEFLSDLKNIKIVRKYSTCKCITPYQIVLVSGGTQYKVMGHRFSRHTQKGVSSFDFKDSDEINDLYNQYLNKILEEQK